MNKNIKTADDKTICNNDFVLLTFPLGNDFVPPMVSLEDVDNALNLLIELYSKLNLNLSLITGQIIWENLNKFFEQISLIEKTLLAQKAMHEWTFPFTILEKILPKQLNDIKALRTEGPRTKYKLVEFTDETFEIFKYEWYENIFGAHTDEANEWCGRNDINLVTFDEVGTMINQYLSMFQWILYYYLGGAIKNDIIYPYRHAPLLIDVRTTLNNILNFISLEEQGENKTNYIDLEDVTTNENDSKITWIHQLVAVLPPSAAYLIPEKYRKLILECGPLADLCPINFLTELEGTNKEWQLIAILPTMDMARVIKEVDQIGYFEDEVKNEKDIVSVQGRDEITVKINKPDQRSYGRGRGRQTGGRQIGGRQTGGRGRTQQLRSPSPPRFSPSIKKNEPPSNISGRGYSGRNQSQRGYGNRSRGRSNYSNPKSAWNQMLM